jgi:hypothetical protein
MTVAVDDYLPWAPSTGSYLNFDQPASDHSIWGPLMEKVWAKINANYEYIEGGNSYETFNLILGAPSKYYSMTGSSIGFVAGAPATATAIANAWSLISTADANNYVMGAGVGSSNSLGLPGNHAYSLLGVAQIKTNNVVTNNLYHIRNPWGVDVYTGPWNDKDTTRWTASA